MFYKWSNKNPRAEIKNSVEGFKSRLDSTEEMVHELEYRPEGNMKTSLQLQQDKNFKKYRKGRLRDIWDPV